MKRQVKKFDKKINMDTATAEKIQKTNEELHKYLQQKGEATAAKQVAYLIKNQGAGKTDESKPNPVYDKLLATNQKILEIIRKMQRDMVDEQDTSIKKVERKEKNGNVTIVNNYYGSEDEEDESGLGLRMPRRRGRGKDKNPRKKRGTGKTPTKTPPKVPAPTGGGPATIPTGTPETSSPDKPKTTGKDGKTGGKSAGKAAGKAAKGGKILSKLLAFAKPIPIIGTAIAAGTAAYAAYDGWENASGITGIPEENLTTTHKIAAAAGSVVSDFTFGVVGADSVAKQALRFSQPVDIAAIEKKYVEEGVISDPMFGNNEVLNWAAIDKLPAYEIERIIQIDDWSDEDKKKLWEANKRAAVRESIKSDEQFLTEEGVSKNTSTEPKVQTTTPHAPSTGGGTTPSTSGGTGGGGAGTAAGAGAAAAAKGSGKYAGVSGAPIPNEEQSKAPIISVEDFGPGWCVVKRSDGTIEKRIGNRNWRNNNPGNIEFGAFTQKHGALAGDPRFAIFPTYDAGRNAKRELIFQGKNYTNLTLSQAIGRYAPPGENNTNMYIQAVLGAVGVERVMKDYSTSEQDTILNAMQRVEGWKIGRVELIEKGTGETNASKATPTANTPNQVGNNSGGGGGVTTPMNIEKGGNFSGPSSAKQTSSGVNKTATTTANVTTGGGGETTSASKTAATTNAVVDKTNRENLVQQSNTNLVSGTKQYDTATSGGANISSSSVNANINKSKPQTQDVGQDNILNYFS